MSDRYIDIGIAGAKSLHQYEELIKLFLRPEQFCIRDLDSDPQGTQPDNSDKEGSIILKYDVSSDEKAKKTEDRYRVARSIYDDLAAITGKRPEWGVLTGIRPVKLAGEVLDGIYGDVLEGYDGSEENRIVSYLSDRYLIHEDKAKLVYEILKYQDEIAGDPPGDSFSMYVGIPFCPTRCLYCSFTSNTASEEEMRSYVDALLQEIEYCAKATEISDIQPESIYIGGGTPTALESRLLDRVLDKIGESFDMSSLREFTLEAGRPDTITDEKLEILRKHGIDKISINPQSMKQDTLDLIGRKHSVEDTIVAFEKARRAGIGSINMDLIAGLPGERLSDFENSLKEVISLDPEKITVHTLAVKRSSGLKERDQNFSYRDEEMRAEMIVSSDRILRNSGYRPYYLYRQKYTTGSTENTGWCKGDHVGIYNIRIMDEHQSILALGAGGISKRFYPDENRLERIPNVSNYEIYIDRIDEMIERKKNLFFNMEEERQNAY